MGDNYKSCHASLSTGTSAVAKDRDFWEMEFSLDSSVSWVQLSGIPWTVACQDSLSMGFSRQECWSGLPFPSPEDFPDQGIKPGSLALQADSLPFELQGRP